MSKATKRKHVLMEVLQDDFSLPAESQLIVRVLNSRGNNLHEVQGADNSTFLITMPTKFRRNVWVKRGDFVLAEPIKEGDKVKAEMIRVLTNEHVKWFKKEGVWPAAFSETEDKSKSDDSLFVNTNRVCLNSESSTTDTTDEEDDKTDICNENL